MRKIKFRAWNKIDKRMSECDFLAFISNGIRFFWTDNGRDETMVLELKNGDFELLQFTGLNDKNGKEIYEGDILQREWDNFIFVVEFKNGSFICNQNTNDKFAILGNIYENPELLEEAK